MIRPSPRVRHLAAEYENDEEERKWAERGEVIRLSGHIYIKGRGLLGFNYRNVCEARYSHTVQGATLRATRSLAATFPFLQERTGALASAVNCAAVIRSKAVVLSAPSRDGCALRLSVIGRAYADEAFHL